MCVDDDFGVVNFDDVFSVWENMTDKDVGFLGHVDSHFIVLNL